MKYTHIHLAGFGGDYYDVEIQNHKFTSIQKSTSPGFQELWMAPCLMDLHLHLGWTDFFHEVQEKRTKEEIKDRIQNSLRTLSSLGVCAVREAGGISVSDLQKIETETHSGLVLPDQWVKIFATGGVGATGEKALLPLLSEAQFARKVHEIHQSGKKVMVHTYGGETLDWCIRYGVDSVEHAVYMTQMQAAALAQKQIFYVPTVSIYRLLASGFFDLPDFLLENAKKVCAIHPRAIKYALEEGVLLGFGTDFYSDPALLAHEPEELFAMHDCGIPMSEVWKSATEYAARFLELRHSKGRIEVNYDADFILFQKDPFLLKNRQEWTENFLFRNI